VRLLGDVHQRAGVIADDHGVAFGGVLEVVEHPLFLQQALDEVEVGLAVLGNVGIALLRAGQAELMTEERRAQGEYFGDHLLDRVALEDPRVEAVLEHREPRVEGSGVARHAAVAGDACEVTGDVAQVAFGQLDFDADVLPHHGFEWYAGGFADQQQFVVERPRQTLDALEGF